jgi:hypothetical protein
MISLLIHTLAVIGMLALIAVVLAVVRSDKRDLERAYIDLEVRRAERRIHDIARQSFVAMLEEARSQEPRRKD